LFTKKNKALLAAGAGAAIMLASGASFALWQDDANFANNDITTGHLSLTLANGELRQFTNFIDEYGEWVDITAVETEPGAGVVIADAEDFILVPGDKVSVTFEDAVIAIGNNIAFEVTLIDNLDPATLTIYGLTADVVVTPSDTENSSTVEVIFDWRDAIEVTPDGSDDGMDETLAGAIDGVDISNVRVTQTRG